MKELIAVPIVALLLLTVLAQLEAVAHDTSDKVIDFSKDMSSAMDCATRAIPIEKCSPNLFNHNFTNETTRLIEVLEEIETLEN